MSFNPRVHKQNNIKYSTAHTNALLNLAQTQSAETIILENMLQSRLDKIEKAKKKSKKFGRWSKILSKIIPGKIDDAILGLADAANKDRLRAKAYGGIDQGNVTLLKDAAREVDSQARKFSRELMKDMKFSASMKKLVSEKMLSQLAELPEIKALKESFNDLSIVERLKPKNLIDFVKGSGKITGQFMKNPVKWMKRYEKDPVTGELLYKGTLDNRKAFDLSLPKDVREEYKAKLPKRPPISIESEVEDLAEDFIIEETPLDTFEPWEAPAPRTALDVINEEAEVSDLMIDGSLLEDIKVATPAPTRPGLEFAREIEDMEGDLPIDKTAPLDMFKPWDEPSAKPIPPQPDRPEIALAQEEEDYGLPTDINLGLQTPIGGGAYRTEITTDPETLKDVYGTSYMNYAVDTLGDTLLYQTAPYKVLNHESASRSGANRMWNQAVRNQFQDMNRIPIPEGMTVDEMESQFSGFYNQTNQQEIFDSWGRRKQKKFMRQNPNMFQRGRR
jgi:hypothetical protein